MRPHLLVTVFPETDGQALHWWYFEDSALVQSGCDSDPLLAAGLKMPVNAMDEIYFAVVLPAALTTVRWHAAIEEATEKQGLTAAVIAARDQSITGSDVHVAGMSSPSETFATAAIDNQLMQSGIGRCQQLGFDPDAIIPAGWLIQPSEGQLVEADFGFDKILRGEEMILPDDPSLRQHLTNGMPVKALAAKEIESVLMRAGDEGLLDLRSGTYTKKTRKALDGPQRRLLGGLVAALVLVSLAIPLMQLAKYYWAADTADAAAVTAAETVVGPVDDIELAERQLDERLIIENKGNIVFSVPAATLFEAVQKAPGVTIDRLTYEQSGIVAATLSAVRNEDINPVLLNIQDAGFLITATPRTDATGAAKADVTVRAP
ncbi:hypothetical protein [Parasphingorhabdus sp.]|uniref:hypothetical protein n=1 Tax=Parasphingorhabdus sp. TaxID=2709688 RepID=UPI003266550E